jgi:hypothetical protein
VDWAFQHEVALLVSTELSENGGDALLYPPYHFTIAEDAELTQICHDISMRGVWIVNAELSYRHDLRAGNEVSQTELGNEKLMFESEFYLAQKEVSELSIRMMGLKYSVNS